MRSLCALIAISLVLTRVKPQSPVFLVDPVSVAAVDGTTVEFTCTANNSGLIDYRVNGTSATLGSVISKGFQQPGADELGNMVLNRNLTVTVSSLYNNTEIHCVASPGEVKSQVADLTIQGPLPSVGSLSAFINATSINISWSPPFTLPGTAITGYNISVTSNGTTNEYFTLNNYYLLQLSNKTYLPCNEINITVSGYNGLDGEAITASVSSFNSTIPIFVDVTKDLQLNVAVNISNICAEERPTAVHSTLFKDDGKLEKMNLNVQSGPASEILTFYQPFTINEDTFYKIKAFFSIFNGYFDFNISQSFHTFGVQSVDLNDTNDDRVFCCCFFNSFSTDTGCTIKLLSLGAEQYEANFSKNGSAAKGYIIGVKTGLYQVEVSDQGSSVVVITSEINVTQESLTNGNSEISSSMSLSPTLVPGSSSTIPSVLMTPPSIRRDQLLSTVLYISIAIPIGMVFIVLFAVLLTLAACFMWKKNRTIKTKPSDCGNNFQSQPCELPKSFENDNYAEVNMTEKKHRPKPRPPADTTVVYSDHIMKGQPPPPPYEPVELKQATDLQASASVIPARVKVDDTGNCNPPMDYDSCHHLLVEKNYPPPPVGRAPSPPNEDEGEPFFVSDCHQYNSVGNAQYIPKEGSTNGRLHPVPAELTSV